MATDRLGRRFSPRPTRTDPGGRFNFSRPIPHELLKGSGENVGEVEVKAKICLPKESEDAGTIPVPCDPDHDRQRALKGTDRVTLGTSGTSRKISISERAFLPVPLILLIIILLAVFHMERNYKMWKYYVLIGLSFLFTFLIVGYVLIGLTKVSDIGSPGEVLTLGFLDFFHGSYVSGSDSNWIVTLTGEANEVVATDQGENFNPVGLGAPLWVILMSVFGSAAFTLLFLVKQVGRLVNRLPEAPFRQEIQQIVMHQIYLLFAPIGAVFLYQMLILADAASHDVTVGIFALSSGLGLNLILAASANRVVGLVGDGKDEPPRFIP